MTTLTPEEREAKIRDKKRRIVGGLILSIFFPPLIILVIIEIIELYKLVNEK